MRSTIVRVCLRCAGVAILSVLFVFAPIACCVGGLISLRP